VNVLKENLEYLFYDIVTVWSYSYFNSVWWHKWRVV